MQKILIIGAGFGGLTAARDLCRSGLGLEVALIDKKNTLDFLPLLPDCIGCNINPEYLTYNLETAAGGSGFKFINEEVNSVDLGNKIVLTLNRKLDYDYLVIASGSEANFYGNDEIKKYVYRLDNVKDARLILEGLERNNFDYYIIFGAGYTGIEIATNLRMYLNKKSKNKRIIIAEKASSILGPLPEWMKEYTCNNLKKLNIELCLNSVIIEKIEERKVGLSCLKLVNNAMLIWAAGAKSADFLEQLDIDKDSQGRLKVDDYLRINKSCFCIGDAAYFSYKGKVLRMAVQFAIAQGESAAANIIRDIRGLELKRYKPRDLGFIIPMANNRSCGNVLGMNLKGALPTALHFLMCTYRSYGTRNKFGILYNLLCFRVRGDV